MAATPHTIYRKRRVMNNHVMLVLAMAAMLCAKTDTYASRTYDMVVAKDSTGKYHTIQEAVDASPHYPVKEISIFIKNGVYHEKIVIPPEKSHITFVGESVDGVVITFEDYSGKLDPAGKKITTQTSATILIAASNITFETVTFVNAAGRVGQAVALHVEGDRCVFRNCKVIGDQDTLLAAGENSRQYFVDCSIEGTTDFIFGPATAVFERCTIKSKKNSYVTAASTPATRAYGFVFLDCRLIAADTGATKVYLGRPWRPFAAVAFVRCEMGAHIVPAGWHNWNKEEADSTARYCEYQSSGPGAHPEARVSWSRQLTTDEADRLTPNYIFDSSDKWAPASDDSAPRR
jgi:pectinesterase